MLKIKRQDIWISKLQLTTLKQQCKRNELFFKRLQKGVHPMMENIMLRNFNVKNKM